MFVLDLMKCSEQDVVIVIFEENMRLKLSDLPEVAKAVLGLKSCRLNCKKSIVDNRSGDIGYNKWVVVVLMSQL